ncbi:MAG: NAD(+) synthase [Bacteroides sp.]|nr:NAD(+) synthase [Bacteroides sp.]
MKQGYFRVAAAVPHVNVADVDYNVEQIKAMAKELDRLGVQLSVFPELCVTAYTCADLFHQQTLLNAAQRGVESLKEFTRDLDSVIIIGAPMRIDGAVYNCGIALGKGEILNVTPKTYLPDYNEFYEKRWFQPSHISANTPTLLSINGVKVGIEICEDLWAPIPPSTKLALAGAQIIVNLSASDDLIGKYAYLTSLIKQQSARCISGYVYASAGYGESSTDLVFDGKAIIAENGVILNANKRWTRKAAYEIADIDITAIDRDRLHTMTFNDCAARENASAATVSIELPEKDDDTLLRTVDPYPFVPPTDGLLNERCEEIVNIQAAGLAKRLEATHTKNLVVGISGGLDSTLALLIAVKTFDMLSLPRTGIHGITMPGFGTTDRTYENAISLMKTLGVSIREIPIADAVKLHFRDISHDIAHHDVTYENSQARERTQILMDIANQVSGMVLGTGDLSELALGWATYNGDHMSMYGVNAGVPKTLVKYLVKWFAENAATPREKSTLLDIVDTPISPELIPADSQGNITQKTEDLVGPYELHDFFLYNILRYGFSPTRIYFLAQKAFKDKYDNETIKKWLKTFCRRFFNQQFKRSCLPDGPKVGSVCLSPRGDWRMPSDASSALWLKECESL